MKGENNMPEKMKIDGLESSVKRTIIVDLPDNSKTSKVKEEFTTEKKVSKVVRGKVVERKKSLGKKFAETVMGDEGSDLNSVVSYVVRDIILPNVKSLIFDVIIGSTEMKLFGTTSGRRNRGSSSTNRGGSSGKTYTSYNSMSSSRDNDRDADRKAQSDRNRARHNFDDIVLESRGDAEEVLDKLRELTFSEYGAASVGDLYELIGITSSFADNNYGWTNLRSARAVKVRDGFILDLPKTQVLD